MRHYVDVKTEQAECCDNPTHTKSVARCSCGWMAEEIDAGRDTMLGAQILEHRVAALEETVEELEAARTAELEWREEQMERER